MSPIILKKKKKINVAHPTDLWAWRRGGLGERKCSSTFHEDGTHVSVWERISAQNSLQ